MRSCNLAPWRTRGKTGKGVAFRGRSDAAENMTHVASDMRQQAGTRGDLLTTAQNAVSDAEHAASTSDAAGFEQSYARASEALNESNKIRESAAASSLGIGWAVDRSAAPLVNATLQEVEKVRQLSNTNRRPVDVAVYAAIDDREAVINCPPPLAWIAATMIEAMPLTMPCLLLLGAKNRQSKKTWPPPLYAPQPRSQPSRVAAE
jgi:hypothetical protein